MNELALFAGAGGGILGGILCGWRTVCAVEIEDYPRRVLMQRQDDGILPPFPIWDDICTFDGKPWRGVVDIVTGGFPCQDISCAGKGAGIDGARSGLWREMARVVREVRPSYVLVENSPMLTSRGLGHVLRDLAEMGYDARWGVYSAADAGARHQRERLWVIAYSDMHWMSKRVSAAGKGCGQVGFHDCGILQGRKNPFEPENGGLEPLLSGACDGMACRVDRLRAISNGQVPAVVRLAWETLSQGMI